MFITTMTKLYDNGNSNIHICDEMNCNRHLLACHMSLLVFDSFLNLINVI